MHFAGRMTRSSFLNLSPVALPLATLSALYLLQTATPLRIDNDVVDYLRLSAAIADGRPLPDIKLPLGYPLFISVLDRAGLGSSLFFVLANCLFLGLGLWAVWKIFDDCPPLLRQMIVLLTLLVTQIIRSVALPLPETAFFATSLLSLMAMKMAVLAEGRRRMAWFGTAFVLVVVATGVRLAGVALIPALLSSCLVALHHSRPRMRTRRWLGVATIVIVVLFAASVVVLAKTTIFADYIAFPRYWYVGGELTSPVTRRLTGTFASIGELILNIPRSRFHSLKPIFVATGVVSILGLVVTLSRPVRPTPVSIYLLSYIAILVFWPYDSPRLWMPITPLLVAHVVSTLARYSRTPVMRQLIMVYSAWFALAGLGAIAYTTRISLSRDEFARLYGRNGGMATENQEGPTTPEMQSRYNALADAVLRRYGNRGGVRQQ